MERVRLRWSWWSGDQSGRVSLDVGVVDYDDTHGIQTPASLRVPLAIPIPFVGSATESGGPATRSTSHSVAAPGFTTKLALRTISPRLANELNPGHPLIKSFNTKLHRASPCLFDLG